MVRVTKISLLLAGPMIGLNDLSILWPIVNNVRWCDLMKLPPNPNSFSLCLVAD